MRYHLSLVVLALAASAHAAEPNATTRFLGEKWSECRVEYEEANRDPGTIVHLDGAGHGAVQSVALRGFFRDPDRFVTRRRLALEPAAARAIFALAVEADLATVSTIGGMLSMEPIPPRLTLENGAGERLVIEVRHVPEKDQPRLAKVIAALRALPRDGERLGDEVPHDGCWRPWPVAIIRFGDWSERALRRERDLRALVTLPFEPSVGPRKPGVTSGVLHFYEVTIDLTGPDGETGRIGLELAEWQALRARLGL
jgi:hypothetical protein